MTQKLTYTHEELLAEQPYATRIHWKNTLFHGGLDAQGNYLPPRSRYRPEAIAAWTARLAAHGQPTQAIDPDQLRVEFFPTVEQSKLLLRNGARGAMTRILTLIGVTEGFGNDGIQALPRPQLQPFFKESIDHTALNHLYTGLFEAHGNDEAGRGNEAGHDVMWYVIRDAALESPRITPDMFENLPLAPPPGYQGPAKAAPDALSISSAFQFQFPALDPLFEVLLTALAQILAVEILAYAAFSWAKAVLSDPACSAAPEFAPRTVDYIQQDENIHVAYLQCALSEARCRTLLGQHGEELSGQEVIDAICQRVVRAQLGSRRERMNAYRMNKIREELATRSDGETLLTQFAALGPIPVMPEAAVA
jgi:hypothetical protein